MAQTQAASKTAAGSAENLEPGLYEVFDTLAQFDPGPAKTREHMPVPGSKYALSSTVPTKMPREHALKFLCDDAFVVRDENGHRLSPVPQQEAERHRGAALNLRRDQAIAHYGELKPSALLARCHMAGGHHLTSAHTSEDMIAYLTGEAANMIAARTGDLSIADAHTEEMDIDSVSRAFGRV